MRSAIWKFVWTSKIIETAYLGRFLWLSYTDVYTSFYSFIYLTVLENFGGLGSLRKNELSWLSVKNLWLCPILSIHWKSQFKKLWKNLLIWTVKIWSVITYLVDIKYHHYFLVQRPHDFCSICICVGTILLLTKITDFLVTYEGSRQEVHGVQKSDSKEKVRYMCVGIIHLVYKQNFLKNISYRLIRTAPENFAYILNEWSHT